MEKATLSELPDLDSSEDDKPRGEDQVQEDNEEGDSDTEQTDAKEGNPATPKTSKHEASASAMERFKHAVRVHVITGSLMTGRPIPREWGFPDFVARYDMFLQAQFGGQGLEAYRELSAEQQEEARSWYERHGEETAAMFGGELWEDWCDRAPGRFDLHKLQREHKLVYDEVAVSIAVRAFKDDKELAKKAALAFVMDPDLLTKTIMENVHF